MDWPSEIERMISGYKSAIEVIREVAGEDTGEAAAQLKSIMEVFDLYRAPLEVMWGSLSPAQQQQVRDLDGELLAADEEVHQLIGVSLSDQLKRIGKGTSRDKRSRGKAA